jgi:hypothetical protein
MFRFLTVEDKPYVALGSAAIGFVDDLFAFFDDAFHCRTFRCLLIFAQDREDLFYPAYMVVGLEQVIFKSGAKLVGVCGLGQFRKGLDQFLLGPIDIL